MKLASTQQATMLHARSLRPNYPCKMPARRLASIIALGFLLAGCATRPVPVAHSRPVAAKRLLADYAFYSHPVHHGAKLVVIRDAGRFDGPESAQVIVDGHAVAFLRPGERVNLYVYAGDRQLGASADPGLLAAPLVAHPFNIQPGRTYHFRVGIVRGKFDVSPATPGE